MKFLKAVFAFCMAVCMVIPVGAVAAGDLTTAAGAETEAESIELDTLTVMGETWYLVKTEAQLRAIGSERYTLDEKYMLDADIDMSDAEWIPIGQSYDNAFTGTFNGNGFTIKGMTMQDPKADLIGFFGYARGADLTNITLEELNFEEAGSEAPTISAGTVVIFGLDCELNGNSASGI